MIYNRLLGRLFVKTSVEAGVSFFEQGGMCRPSYHSVVDPRDLSSYRRNVKHISEALVIYWFRFSLLSTISDFSFIVDPLTRRTKDMVIIFLLELFLKMLQITILIYTNDFPKGNIPNRYLCFRSSRVSYQVNPRRTRERAPLLI